MDTKIKVSHLNGAPQQIPDVQMQNRTALMLFAILQFVFGIGLIALDIITFSMTPLHHAMLYSIIGSGFWAGAFFTLSGLFGIISSRRSTCRNSFREHRCHLGIMVTTSAIAVIASMALTIITGVAFILKLTGLGRYAQYERIGVNLMIAHFALYVLISIFNIGQIIASLLNFCRLKATSDRVTVYLSSEHPPAKAAGLPASVSYPVLSHIGGLPVSFSYPALVTVTSLGEKPVPGAVPFEKSARFWREEDVRLASLTHP
ncbi:uncharacterized protein LOC129588411 [Paramacrobiotus metropolitanus]|uniref:uncharacterized protein LOC129588411 n=1 Tax=Paramacrobiotus metropolitanus TaxID=2943436 RepID=UPI002445DC0F|nr:uncharacterized protein LOC129588411 [Paramacrobiotus metropolitanus]